MSLIIFHRDKCSTGTELLLFLYPFVHLSLGIILPPPSFPEFFFFPSDFRAISTIPSKEAFNKPEDRKVLLGLVPFSSSSRKANVHVTDVFDGSLWEERKYRAQT